MINMLERSTRLGPRSNIPERKLMPRPKGRRRKLQGDRSRSGRGARLRFFLSICRVDGVLGGRDSSACVKNPFFMRRQLQVRPGCGLFHWRRACFGRRPTAVLMSFFN